MSSMAFFSDATVGSELFNFVRLSVKCVGSVTLFRASKLGTESVGGLKLTPGIRLMPLTAEAIALLTDPMSF